MSSNHVKIDSSGGIVTKKFRSAIALDNELCMLAMLKDSGMTPRLISTTSDSLTLGYIEGRSLLELLELADSNCTKLSSLMGCLVTLLDWLTSLATRLKNENGCFPVLDDLQLRNFIINADGNIIGIDFEHWHYGEQEDNYARLLAVITSYRINNNAMVEQLSATICNYVLSNPCLSYGRFIALVEQRRSELLLFRSVRRLMSSSTAVILSGGQGRRMGTQPKALLASGDFTFLDRTIYALSCFDRVMLSVAQQGQLPGGSCPCWYDINKGCGPIGGLHTALAKAQTPLIFVTPCDTPRINQALITLLYANLTDNDDCVVPYTEDGAHPLCGIYRCSILPQLERQIESGSYKVMQLLDRVRTKQVQVRGDAAAALCNINTPEQYNSLIAH